jgi:hypothetical protein
MRFLLIAVLSVAAWFAPLSASAAQVQSPLYVTVVSLWGAPVTPGTVLDPSDPGVLDHTAALLSFASYSTGDPLLPQDLDARFSELVGSFPTDLSTGSVQEVNVPPYGLGSRGGTGIEEGLLYDFIVIYDERHMYLFMALAEENSPSAMPILTGIADQMFDPTRPDYSTETVRVLLEGFSVGVDAPHEPLLSRLPQRAEVPAEYQLLFQDAIIT